MLLVAEERPPDRREACLLATGRHAHRKHNGVVMLTDWSLVCILLPVRRSSSASCTKRRRALGIAASGPFFLPMLAVTSIAA